MTPEFSSRDIPPVRYCGSYDLGHDVHFIQVRLSREICASVVENVGDTGTIVFNDGTTVWNHDPERLRRFSRSAAGTFGVSEVRIVCVHSYSLWPLPQTASTPLPRSWPSSRMLPSASMRAWK